MDVERALVSKIIATGQIEEAISKGVRTDLFADEECRDMYQYIIDHSRRYKSAPSMEAVKNDRPNFEWLHIQDSLAYVIDKFVVLAKRRLAQEMVLELAAATDDPDRAPNIELEFLEVSRKLATVVPSAEVAYFKRDMDKRIQEYEQRASEGKAVGVPFGFPTLDAWTGGIQPHEFAVIAGFSSIGKSTMLIRIAFNAFMEGYTPLYISLEMERKVILRRWDAMAASLDYTAMKQLALPAEQIEQWRDTKERIQDTVGEIPIIDSIRHCTPENIYAEGIRHEPDLILIDYLTLMRSSRPARASSMWQSVTEITQDLKQNARAMKIPIIAAAQTNRGGAKDGAELDNVGYSISVTQDPDIVVGLAQTDAQREEKELEIRLMKNRDGKIGRFMAVADHERQILREKVLKDMFQRQDD